MKEQGWKGGWCCCGSGHGTISFCGSLMRPCRPIEYKRRSMQCTVQKDYLVSHEKLVLFVTEFAAPVGDIHPKAFYCNLG